MQKENKSKTIRIDWVPDRDSDVPLYLQIVNYFGEQIQRGNWTGGRGFLPREGWRKSSG